MFLLPIHLHYSLTSRKCSVCQCCTHSQYVHLTVKKNKSCSFYGSSEMLLFLWCVVPVPKAVQKLSFPADLIMNRCIWMNFGAFSCANKSCLAEQWVFFNSNLSFHLTYLVWQVLLLYVAIRHISWMPLALLTLVIPCMSDF